MNNVDKYLNNLPDDLIRKIYAKIYYPQNPKLLNEIRLFHYIKKKLVYDYGLYNVCCCAIIQRKYSNETITIEDIDSIHNTIISIDDNNKNAILNNMISAMSAEDKYAFIFHITDKTIKPNTKDTNSYIKFVVDNVMYHYY
jgi:hypothetical protein